MTDSSKKRWNIPESWAWVAAGEIAEIIGGGTPPTGDPSNFAEDGVRWLTPADLSKNKATYVGRGSRDLSEKGLASCGATLLPQGAVLFTSRAPIGYCAIAANPIATNQGFKSLIPKGGISPEFLRHYLLSAKAYAESFASGSTFKELSGARTAQLAIPIAPLPEQRRIVTQIEALTERSRRAREALDAIPPLLERFRQSVLAAAFRGDLTADWREQNPDVEHASVLLERIRAERRRRWEEAELAKMRARGKEPLGDEWKAKYVEPEPVDESGLPELPERWCWTNVDQLTEFVTSGSRGWAEYYSENGALFLRVGNLDRHTIALDLRETVRVSPPPGAEGVRTRVQGRDILVTITADVGMVAVAPEDIGEAYINQHVALCRPLPSVNSRAMAYSLIDPTGLQALVRKIQYGVTKASLSLIQVRSFPVPLPPSEEQVEIERRVDALLEGAGAVEARLRRAKGLANQLDQSILAKAFRGELVPQDPGDEPASVLLARIRAERSGEQR